VLEALASPGPPPPVPPAGAAAWDLFLRVERVALPLSAALGAGAPAAEHAEVLRRALLPEMQRALSARAMLKRIARVAAGRGLEVAVLKGAVAVLRRGAPDLADVDVLASPEDAAVLAEEVDRMGYAESGVPGAHALKLRAAGDSIPVEIHTTVPGTHGAPRERLRPAAEMPPLRLLHPADHLWYVLHHATEQHAERRGSLRDLLVLADALHACAPDERAEVERWVADHERPELLRRVLRMADAVARRTGAPRDEFQLDAAGRFVAALWQARAPRSIVVRLMVAHAITAAVARRTGEPGGLGRVTLDAPSGYPLLAWMRKRLPRAERMVRLAIRHGPEWALYPLGAAAARAAERAVRRVRAP
jgi:hypothetical protein